jgi:hypothetical protein
MTHGGIANGTGSGLVISDLLAIAMQYNFSA